MDLNALIADKHEETKKIENYYKPEFYRISKKHDKINLFEILSKKQNIQIFDDLDNQLKELIKSIYPQRKFNKEEIKKAIKEHKAERPHNEYGVWVYYPWSEKLVHILDEEEFIEVRTNRNRNKITREEQDQLAQKKVGVVGLSVGQSVSVTMAMERTAGEIRLADFDLLELSNLNRIRTGVHNLGLAKVTAVAREISEIDPFLKVTCFHEGLHEENIEDFMLKDGKLDILIDECDGLDIKIQSRLKARELGIPVVMEASERGTLDVERFDLEPDRSLLHGLIDHLDLSKVKEAKTNEEKVPYILPMIGWETISDRMKASMLEIESSITTWPQLASAVTYGGGMTTDVCRRILLDEYHESGRYIVDVAEIVKDKDAEEKTVEQETSSNGQDKEHNYPTITIEPNIKPIEKPSNEYIHQLIERASKAPSGGNSQPWKFQYKDGLLLVLHDKDNSQQYLDYKDRGAYISIGAIIDQIKLEAYKDDLRIEVHYNEKSESLLIATIIFSQLKDAPEEFASEDYRFYQDYYPDLSKRVTNRNIKKSDPIPTNTLNLIKQEAEKIDGAELTLVTDENNIAQLADIIGSSDRMLMTNKQSHMEFYHEIQWNEQQAQENRKGIDVRTIDLTPTEVAGFELARNWSVVNYLNKWGGGKSFEKLGKKSINNSAAVGLLTMPGYSKENFIKAGKSILRFWTIANKNNVCIQPMSATIFLYARMLQGNNEGLSSTMIKDLEKTRPVFEQLFDTNSQKGEVFLFRMFIGEDMKIKSLRKNVADILEFPNAK